MRLLALILLAWLPSAWAAGLPWPQVATDSCATQPGAWSLQVGFDSHFSLTKVDGLSLSMARDLNGGRRLKLGFSLHRSVLQRTGNTLRRSLDYEGDSLVAHDYTVNGIGGSVIAQVQWLSPPREEVRWVLGLGPSLRRSSWVFEGRQLPDFRPPMRIPTDSRSRTTGLGVRASLGAEWRVTSILALQADYTLSVERSWTRTREVFDSPYQRQVQDVKSQGWSVGDRDVQLILLLFF